MNAAEKAAGRKLFEAGLSGEGDDILTFRHSWTDGGFVFEARSKGLDPPRQQLERLYKVMSKGVFDVGIAIEVVMIVRPCPE